MDSDGTGVGSGWGADTVDDVVGERFSCAGAIFVEDCRVMELIVHTCEAC
jgi:hypothetical protein